MEFSVNGRPVAASDPFGSPTRRPALAAAARELAAALHAPVGLAASLEVAQLAALRAKPGEVREVGRSAQAEKLFLSLTPVEHLTTLGLNPAQVEPFSSVWISA